MMSYPKENELLWIFIKSWEKSFGYGAGGCWWIRRTAKVRTVEPSRKALMYSEGRITFRGLVMNANKECRVSLIFWAWKKFKGACCDGRWTNNSSLAKETKEGERKVELTRSDALFA